MFLDVLYGAIVQSLTAKSVAVVACRSQCPKIVRRLRPYNPARYILFNLNHALESPKTTGFQKTPTGFSPSPTGRIPVFLPAAAFFAAIFLFFSSPLSALDYYWVNGSGAWSAFSAGRAKLDSQSRDRLVRCGQPARAGGFDPAGNGPAVTLRWRRHVRTTGPAPNGQGLLGATDERDDG
jgi:hypothetical protein